MINVTFLYRIMLVVGIAAVTCLFFTAIKLIYDTFVSRWFPKRINEWMAYRMWTKITTLTTYSFIFFLDLRQEWFFFLICSVVVTKSMVRCQWITLYICLVEDNKKKLPQKKSKSYRSSSRMNKKTRKKSIHSISKTSVQNDGTTTQLPFHG